MATAQKLRKVFGTAELPTPSVWLAVGPLRVQVKDGNIGSIEFDGIEILRGISFLVRDENWGTCAAKVSNLKISRGKGGFTVSYQATANNGAASLQYHATIRGTPNRVIFSAKGKPSSDFKTNRTGFVVLHPINGVAGKPVTITHMDGSTERARFPKHISPGQPLFEIRALQHAPASGLTAKVLMEGSKFEMEDQRNWTDASYKTYVCSLLDPWPYMLKGGEVLEQKITVLISGRAKLKSPVMATELEIGKSIKLPEIGVAIPQNQAVQSLKFTDTISQLSPKHITCTLDGGGDTQADCMAFAAIGHKTGIPITLEIILPGKAAADREMAQIADITKRSGLSPRRLVVTHAQDLKSFQPTDQRPWGPTYEEMAMAARRHFPQTIFGGGMMSYFTELNRKRPPSGVFDFITHSICPIVHDASDEAVMQTLETLPHIFASAKAFIGKAPYHLGPSGIGARMNPYGANLANNPKNRRMCLASNDPRQQGIFACAWNLGVLVATAEAGLHSITLSSVTGPQGLLDTRGRRRPLFDLLAQLIPLTGQRVTKLSAGDAAITGFAFKTEKGMRACLANLSNRPKTAALNGQHFRLSAYETKFFRLRSQ